MEESKNRQVQNFLDDMIVTDPDKSDILDRLRDIVFSNNPDAGERMMYGGIMFSLEDDFGGIFAYKKHVSFEFSSGAEMDDPDGILEGGGKFRRHIKIQSLADIDTKKVNFFVKQTLNRTA